MTYDPYAGIPATLGGDFRAEQRACRKARALAAKPSIEKLIADFRSLDPKAQDAIRAQIADLSGGAK